MNHKNVLKISDLKSNTDLVDPLSGYDLIFLNDFMIDANIGVYKHEKLKRQPLRINVIANDLNFEEAAKLRDEIKRLENNQLELPSNNLGQYKKNRRSKRKYFT